MLGLFVNNVLLLRTHLHMRKTRCQEVDDYAIHVCSFYDIIVRQHTLPWCNMTPVCSRRQAVNLYQDVSMTYLFVSMTSQYYCGYLRLDVLFHYTMTSQYAVIVLLQVLTLWRVCSGRRVGLLHNDVIIWRHSITAGTYALTCMFWKTPSVYSWYSQ